MKMIGVLLGGPLAGLCWPQPASAQDLPPGSYLGSCRNIYLQGDTLIATCRRTDDDYSARPTALLAVQHCVGDIGNVNGTLTCNHARAPATPPQPYFGAPGNAPRPDG
jgi:hypothetical protein